MCSVLNLSMCAEYAYIIILLQTEHQITEVLQVSRLSPLRLTYSLSNAPWLFLIKNTPRLAFSLIKSTFPVNLSIKNSKVFTAVKSFHKAARPDEESFTLRPTLLFYRDE